MKKKNVKEREKNERKNKERRKEKERKEEKKKERKKRPQHWRYVKQKCGGERLMGKVEEQKESFIIILIS